MLSFTLTARADTCMKHLNGEKVDSYQEKRNEVRNWLSRWLIGPFSGNPEEILHSRPSTLYVCGILSGQLPSEDESEESSAQEDKPNAEAESNTTEADGTKRTCRYGPPSALGLSFFVSKDIKIDIMLKGARYGMEDNRKDIWIRRKLPIGNEEFECVTITPSENELDMEREFPVLLDTELADTKDIRLKNGNSSILHTKWRPYSFDKHEGYILTVSLVNSVIYEGCDYRIWEKLFYFK